MKPWKTVMVNTFTNINNTNNDLNSLITKKTRTYANENPGSLLGTAHKCDRSLGSKHLLIGSRITNIKNKYKKTAQIGFHSKTPQSQK